MKIGNNFKSICLEVSHKKEKEAELSQAQLKLKKKLRPNNLFVQKSVEKINAMTNVSQANENSSHGREFFTIMKQAEAELGQAQQSCDQSS